MLGGAGCDSFMSHLDPQVSRPSLWVLGSSSSFSSLLEGSSHACLPPWAPSSWIPSPSTAYCHLSGAWPILPCGRVISGSPRLPLASGFLGTASHLHHCGPGHHPSIIRLTSIILASGSSGLQGLVHGRLSFIRLHIR